MPTDRSRSLPQCRRDADAVAGPFVAWGDVAIGGLVPVHDIGFFPFCNEGTAGVEGRGGVATAVPESLAAFGFFASRPAG